MTILMYGILVLILLIAFGLAQAAFALLFPSPPSPPSPPMPNHAVEQKRLWEQFYSILAVTMVYSVEHPIESQPHVCQYPLWVSAHERLLYFQVNGNQIRWRFAYLGAWAETAIPQDVYANLGLGLGLGVQS